MRTEPTFKGFEAIAVSHADDVAAAAAATHRRLERPGIVRASSRARRRSPTRRTLSADNAATSPLFGNVYVCYTPLQQPAGCEPVKINVTRSTDGGDDLSNPVH